MTQTTVKGRKNAGLLQAFQKHSDLLYGLIAIVSLAFLFLPSICLLLTSD
jgi:hypothetical protein